MIRPTRGLLFQSGFWIMASVPQGESGGKDEDDKTDEKWGDLPAGVNRAALREGRKLQEFILPLNVRVNELNPTGLSAAPDFPEMGRRGQHVRAHNAARGSIAALWYMARFPLVEPWIPEEGDVEPGGGSQAYTVLRVPEDRGANEPGPTFSLLNIITFGDEVLARRAANPEEDFEDMEDLGMEVPRENTQEEVVKMIKEMIEKAETDNPEIKTSLLESMTAVQEMFMLKG